MSRTTHGALVAVLLGVGCTSLAGLDNEYVYPYGSGGSAASSGVGGGAASSSIAAGGGGGSQPTCDDGIMNGDEVGIDCGGACMECGKCAVCMISSDCVGGCCFNGLCVDWPGDCSSVDPCSDGCKDGSETDVDCGGMCMTKCGSSAACATNDDCATGFCSAGTCGLLNGCDPAMATDQTGKSTATIGTMGLGYTPKCMRISTGTEMTFNSNFTLHPLRGGTVEGATKTPDPNSPIKATNSGMTVSYTFPAAGKYGFYCESHAAGGMTGAIFVE